MEGESNYPVVIRFPVVGPFFLFSDKLYEEAPSILNESRSIDISDHSGTAGIFREVIVTFSPFLSLLPLTSLPFSSTAILFLFPVIALALTVLTR